LPYPVPADEKREGPGALRTSTTARALPAAPIGSPPVRRPIDSTPDRSAPRDGEIEVGSFPSLQRQSLDRSGPSVTAGRRCRRAGRTGVRCGGRRGPRAGPEPVEGDEEWSAFGRLNRPGEPALPPTIGLRAGWAERVGERVNALREHGSHVPGRRTECSRPRGPSLNADYRGGELTHSFRSGSRVFPLSVSRSCYPVFGGRGEVVPPDDRAIPSSSPRFQAPSTVRLGPGLPF
jgi:hypothetical protein